MKPQFSWLFIELFPSSVSIYSRLSVSPYLLTFISACLPVHPYITFYSIHLPIRPPTCLYTYFSMALHFSELWWTPFFRVSDFFYACRIYWTMDKPVSRPYLQSTTQRYGKCWHAVHVLCRIQKWCACSRNRRRYTDSVQPVPSSAEIIRNVQGEVWVYRDRFLVNYLSIMFCGPENKGWVRSFGGWVGCGF
jgi:hypothetical protein